MILQESQYYSLLELVDAVSRWMFSVPALVFFGLLPALTVRFLRRTPGRTPFHPCAVLPRPASRTHPLPATPFQCPRSRTATLGQGAAAHFPPLRWPYCTLSRLRAEEYDRLVTQSIATPEPSSRTTRHPRSDAGRPLEPRVCGHTREPTVLSRLSCRPPLVRPLTATDTRLAVGQG